MDVGRLNFERGVFEVLAVDVNLTLAEVVAEVDRYEVDPAVLERKEMRPQVLPVQRLAAMQMAARKLVEPVGRVGVVAGDVITRHRQVVHDPDIVAEVLAA